MASELKESLLYDFNQSYFLAKTMLPNVSNGQDRQNVVRWLRFLNKNAKTIDELKLRNDFMFYLVTGVQEGSLKPPFDKPPPNMTLLDMATLLPGAEGLTEDRDLFTTHSDGTFVTGGGRRESARKPEIIRRSPDGGEFLAAQPIPNVGAFCYLAVVTKKQKSD